MAHTVDDQYDPAQRAQDNGRTAAMLKRLKVAKDKQREAVIEVSLAQAAFVEFLINTGRLHLLKPAPYAIQVLAREIENT